MTVYGAAKAAVKLAGRLDKKYNINKIFVEKYVPPGYRKITSRLFDIAGTAGGAYGIYKALIAEDTPGNSAPVFQKKQPQYNKTYKTRRRLSTRNRRCYPDRYGPSNRKRYS